MRVAGYVIVALLFLWLALAQNGKVAGPVATICILAGMRTEGAPQVLPFCEGCPDQEACSHGGCHLDGGPVHPVTQVAEDSMQPEQPQECTHPGGHGFTEDPNGILGYSCEGIANVDVRNEGYQTRAWTEREAGLRMAAEVRGEDLSFLKGAPRGEREEWVSSWARRYPEVRRSEIAHLLARQAGITLRQAQMDVKAALGPAAESSS